MHHLMSGWSERLRRCVLRFFSVAEARHMLWACLTVVGSEMLCSGVADGLLYGFRHPLAFLFAATVVYISYLLTMLTPCRQGVFILVEGFWAGISVANVVLLNSRINPLSAADFKIVLHAFSILDAYLSTFQIILIFVAISAAVALAVFVMVRLPKAKPNYPRIGVEILISVLLAVVLGIFSSAQYYKSMRKMNLPEAYSEYGFMYSFYMSCIDRGISRPTDYSKLNITTLLTGGSEEDTADDKSSESVSGDGADPSAEKDVNILFVQLESFIDPTYIIGLKTSEDPIPSFRSLKDNYPSGQLTVPVAGGGTVNTEFEILCGIPLSLFGMGEYPYETVLMSEPCESIAYYLREEGYTCHAIHNHTGTFYNRNIVLQNLGFDTFTPVEYMSDVKRNSLGWEKDALLKDEILGTLSSTEGPDFIYTVSVQPHGKYPSVDGEYGSITVSGAHSEDFLYGMKYYVNQLKETDAFVGELVAAAEQLDEKTVIVFFGDHQPRLNLPPSGLKSGSIYTTEYVIWSNFTVEAEDIDLPAYRLNAHVLGLLDKTGGTVTKLHQEFLDDEKYTEYLESLAYDILSGEKYAYGGVFPYEVPVLSFGYKSVEAHGAYIKNETLYVTGEGFTESSVVYIGSKRRDTVYINENLIICDNISAAEDVKIAQVAENGTVFSEIPCPVTDEPE